MNEKSRLEPLSAAGGREPFDLLLVAAGQGERLGLGVPKALIPLAGTPMFLHSLRAIASVPGLRKVVVAGPRDPGALQTMSELAEGQVTVIPGGERRQDSVWEGLRALSESGSASEGIVLIHDAARPLLEARLVHRCLEAMTARAPEPAQSALPGMVQGGIWGPGPAGVVPGIPVRETLKLVYQGRIVLTQPRENLQAVQTPQAFRLGPILQAHRRARGRNEEATDDAALLEWQGIPVQVVPGQATNIKITYPEDLDLAERLIATRNRRDRA